MSLCDIGDNCKGTHENIFIVFSTQISFFLRLKTLWTNVTNISQTSEKNG